jgi:hypothetical protein
MVSSAAFDDPEVQQKLGMSPHLVNIAELLKTATCATCMDKMLVVDMARVPCDHFYRSGCFQSLFERYHPLTQDIG